MRNYLIAAALVVSSATAAQAVTLAPGTAGVGFTSGFTVDLASTPGIFFATNAFVTVSNTTGGFSTPNTVPFPFAVGTVNGVLSFGKTVGASSDESIANFLTFGDISFSVSKVTTVSYAVTPGISSAVSLYLLGTAIGAGTEATPTSLTLSFNNTGTSAFSASASLATPPTTAVPEPAVWAMMLVGFGAMGATMRRRKVSLTFA